MDTELDVPGSGSGSGTAKKKKKMGTSKVANNNNGRANLSWGLVQTLADNKISWQTWVYSANGHVCSRNDCSYKHGQQPGTSPPPPFQLQQQQKQPQRNNGAPPDAPSSGNGVVARFSYHQAGRGTPHGRGGRDGGRGTGNGAAGGRGTGGSG